MFVEFAGTIGNCSTGQAARMIDAGVSYRNVTKQTGLSTATVTRVAKWLKKGEGGYRLILDRVSKHH